MYKISIYYLTSLWNALSTQTCMSLNSATNMNREGTQSTLSEREILFSFEKQNDISGTVHTSFSIESWPCKKIRQCFKGCYSNAHYLHMVQIHKNVAKIMFTKKTYWSSHYKFLSVVIIFLVLRHDTDLSVLWRAEFHCNLSILILLFRCGGKVSWTAVHAHKRDPRADSMHLMRARTVFIVLTKGDPEKPRKRKCGTEENQEDKRHREAVIGTVGGCNTKGRKLLERHNRTGL